MMRLFFSLIFIVSNISIASSLELQNGDVLLISFDCYECRVIESETSSPFSHSGVVIKNEAHEIRIGQSLGFVALYPINQFLKNKRLGTKVSVYRPRDFVNLDQAQKRNLEEKMLLHFNTVFKGAPFDVKYLWNNFDEKGRELLYCSEFIAKFLDHFMSEETIPYPLTYTKNEDYWLKYFNGAIPEGELGNSPAAFTRDSRFIFIGNL